MTRGRGAGSTLPDPGTESLLAYVLRWGGMLWEMIGLLGWLYTPLPLLFMMITIACVGSMLSLSVVDSDEKKSSRDLLVRYLVLMILGITLLMARAKFLWQGRYALPALAACFVLWGGTSSKVVALVIRKVAVIAWVVSALSALWIAARYMFGLQIAHRHAVPNFSEGSEWLSSGSRAVIVLFGLIGIFAIPVAMRLTTKVETLDAVFASTDPVANQSEV